MKIRSKISSSFFIVAMILSIAIYFVVAYISKNKLEEFVVNDSFLLSDGLINNVDELIYRKIEDINIYAQMLNSDPILQDSNKEFATLEDPFEYIRAIDEEWISFGADQITTKIDELLGNTLSQKLSQDLLLEDYYGKEYGFPVYGEIFVTNAYGANVGMTRKTSDYYQADEEWWQQAREHGFFVSDIAYDESADMNAISIAVRISDENDVFSGVIKAVLNVEFIVNNMYAYLTDTSVHHDDFVPYEQRYIKDITFKLATHDGGIIYTYNKKDDVWGNIKKEAYNDLLLGNKDTHAFIKNEETDEELLVVLVHSKGYKDFDGLNWVIITENNTENIFSPIVELKKNIFLTALVISLIFFIVSTIISYIISKPIVKLHKDIEIIQKGDTNHKIIHTSDDEIGQLSRAIESMLQLIKKSRADVDKKVEKQTKEIQINQKELENQQDAILNVLEDVEEEKDRLKEEKDKIDTILNSIGDAVFVVDKNYRIILFNRGAADLSGYDASEVLGHVYTDKLVFLYEHDRLVNDHFIKDAIEKGEVSTIKNHTLFVHKDGHELSIEDSATPLKDKQNNTIGCVVVFRDVTEDMRIDRAKTEFVSLASHQLRTPLTAISWYGEMLLKGEVGKLNKEQKEYLSKMYTSNERMIGLVGSLLNVSRVEMGTFVVDPKPHNLIKVATNVVGELKPLIIKKKIIFTKKYDKKCEHKKIKVDEKLVRIIIQNLLTNAIKYTPQKGTVSLEIKSQQKYVEIIVTDTGYGIPKKQQKDIYTKLFRADNIKTKDTEGTGLGLYLVKSILDSTGGKIWFTSRLNKGSEFHVTIPLEGMKARKGTKELNLTGY